MTRYLLFGIVFATLLSCSSAKKSGVSADDVSRKSIVCSSLHVTGNHLDWHLVDTSTISFPKTSRMPAGYTVYTLDSVQLANFFSQQTSAWNTAVPLPDPAGCQLISLKRSSAMSAELMKKYPKMVSLQSTAEGNAMSDTRLDYDGAKMRGQIKWGNDFYMISPIVSNGRTYYIVFDKKRSGVPKRPFEEQQRPTKRPPLFDR